jgi:Ca-activated chloride channel homolog
MSIAALTIQAPGALLLLAAPLLLAVLAWRGVAPLARRRSTIALLLRLAAITVLVVAIAQPRWRAGAAPGPLIVLDDASGSISAADRAIEVNWTLRAVSRASAEAPVDVVVFAASAALAEVSRPLGHAEVVRLIASRTDRTQTDLAGALQLAAGIAAPGSSIVLLTDGAPTTGDAVSAVSSPAGGRIPIYTVLLNQPIRPDVAITRLVAPKTSPAGVPLPVSVTLTSTQATTATLTVRIDGQSIGSQALPAQAGSTPYQINVPGQPPGWHAIDAVVSAPSDAVPQNNSLTTTTDVAGPARVLLVSAPSTTDAAALLVDGSPVSVTRSTPSAMPALAAKIGRYDSIVLDDVPATALTGKQVSALDTAVHDLGVGLFVLGGTHSLTEGHYSQTALERLLPVTSVTPASFQDGNIALQLVLDRSGSMDNLAGDVPKIVMSRAAALLAADFTFQHKDALGILSFDQASHVLVPMGPYGSTAKTRVEQTIAGMYSDGGTNIFQALQLGIAQVSRSNAPYRHIILMTDGRSDPANYLPALREAQRLKVTISTVALGPDADIQLLHYMAALGKGRFYYTTNARDLPQIFAEEARLSAGSATVTGTIGVQIASNSPTVRSLGASPLPTLSGYTATVLKPPAADDLETITKQRQPDPLLARWQYGLGRVLVWTPGVDNAWSAAWRADEPQFWADMLDWTLRGVPLPSLTPALAGTPLPDELVIDTVANGGTAIDLHDLQAVIHPPSGGSSRLTAVQTAPGTYEAPYGFSVPGVYAVTISDLTSNNKTSALLAVPYSPEYLPAMPNQAFLAQLSAVSGGLTLTDPDQLAALVRDAGATIDLWWAFVVLAIALFVAAIAGDRLMPRMK